LEFFDDLIMITTSTFLNSRVAFIAELAPIIHIGNVAAACDVTDGPNDSQASRPPQQLLFLALSCASHQAATGSSSHIRPLILISLLPCSPCGVCSKLIVALITAWGGLGGLNHFYGHALTHGYEIPALYVVRHCSCCDIIQDCRYPPPTRQPTVTVNVYTCLK